MHSNRKVFIQLFALLLALALPLAAFAKIKVKSEHSDPDAVDAVQAVYSTAFNLREFKSDVHMVIQNEAFLKGFFNGDEGTSTVGLQGLLHYKDVSGIQLLLRRDATEYNCFALGNSVSYKGTRRIKQSKDSKTLKIIHTGDTEATPTPTADSTAAPSDETPGEEPSATPEPSPSPSPDFIAPDVLSKLNFDGFMNMLTPTKVNAPRDYPLAFVVPYVLNSRIQGNVFTVVKEGAYVYNTKCTEILAVNPKSKYHTTLWIDVPHKRLLQVMRTDEVNHNKIVATYVGHFDPDPDSGFTMFQRVEVSVNHIPVFFAELTNLTINPNRAVVEEETEPETPRSLVRNIISDEVVPFLSAQKLKLVIFLCIVLFVLGLRYLMFISSRQEFSDELIVIDEPRGRFSETLNKLGYKVTPFSLEILSKERNVLGRGATKDTEARPRAVIVAPLALEEIRNHTFLLRAYVEDGGRLLIMRHPKKMEACFPFHPELMPIPNVSIGMEYDNTIITSMEEEEVRRLVATYVTNEAYLKIDGRAVSKSLVTVTNKLTNLKATTVGAFKCRKGEYIVCQMNFSSKALNEDAKLAYLFNDLVRYLLGLDPLPYREEEPEN